MRCHTRSMMAQAPLLHEGEGLGTSERLGLNNFLSVAVEVNLGFSILCKKSVGLTIDVE